MFESLDSPAAKSGQDLWAEICSCLPSPAQEDVANNAFSDSFMDSQPEGEGHTEAADSAVQLSGKPWAPLHDSEVYLASLGKFSVCLSLCLSPSLLLFSPHPNTCVF